MKVMNTPKQTPSLGSSGPSHPKLPTATSSSSTTGGGGNHHYHNFHNAGHQFHHAPSFNSTMPLKFGNIMSSSSTTNSNKTTIIQNNHYETSDSRMPQKQQR